MKARLLFLALAACAAGCAPRAVVIVSPNYDSTRILRVAVVYVNDFAGAPGSGEAVAAAFEKYLLWGGYTVVERRQVEQILNEQRLAASGAFDATTIHQLGRLLGVDALAFGTLTDYSDTREHTVMVDIPQEHSDPIYGKVVTTQRVGDTTVRREQDVVTGYSSYETSQVVPQTLTVPARVGLSIRLVDVFSGQILWSGSSSADGIDLTTAAEEASASLMQGVVKQLKKGS